jgi:hypothetical protein
VFQYIRNSSAGVGAVDGADGESCGLPPSSGQHSRQASFHIGGAPGATVSCTSEAGGGKWYLDKKVNLTRLIQVRPLVSGCTFELAAHPCRHPGLL